jgi:hypothetical protein
MDRFILRYTGQGAMPTDDILRIRSHPDVTIEDQSARMFLIQATPEAVSQLNEELSGWICAPERTYPRPDPRPRIRS